MRVTFEIEIDDELVHQLDYYENFVVSNYEGVGCKKCVFYPMCSAFHDKVFMAFDDYHIDCKFPCWANRSDRYHGTDRKVIVAKPNTIRRAEDE